MTGRIHALSAHAIHLGAEIYYRSLRGLGITAVGRRLRDVGPILCYHNVVAGNDCQAGDPGLHVPRERFERQVRWLAAHYDVVSLREFIERLIAGKTLRSVAAITFDDAYAGVFEHAEPLLRTVGIPATIFIIAEAPGRSPGFWWDDARVVEWLTPARRDRWLNEMRGDGGAILSESPASSIDSLPATHRPADWATIRARVGGGIDIGVHSATHRALPTLTDAELEHEIVTSRTVVYQSTGVWPEFFVYPYGYHDQRVRARVRAAGYRAAFGLSSAPIAPSVDLWCLDRVNVPAQISHPAFEAWLSGFRLHRNRS